MAKKKKGISPRTRIIHLGKDNDALHKRLNEELDRVRQLEHQVSVITDGQNKLAEKADELLTALQAERQKSAVLGRANTDLVNTVTALQTVIIRAMRGGPSAAN